MVHRLLGDSTRRDRSVGPRVLVVIDGAAAARRTVSYLVAMLGRPHGLRLSIVHLQPRNRDVTRTVAGQAARALGVALNGRRRRPATTDTQRAARRAFSGAHAVLRGARLATQALETQFFGLAEQPGLAERILELANANRCATVVVGGHSLARTRTASGRTLATDLVISAGDLAVWVVA
jgi:nucleotide-binding universal stress UspA family protein